MKATLIKLNQMNLNHRIYSDNENLRKSIDDFNNSPFKYGELGYTDRFETSFNNISHVVNNVRIEGDEVVADIEILNTQNGKILNENIDNIVFSQRSSGYVDNNGYVHIKRLYSFDAIYSDTDAFLYSNKKEIKRIINDNDPYGEEDWDN